MIHRYRQLAATVLVAACVFAVAACGSSATSTPASGAAAARPAGFKLTTTQRSCLKKHGVTLPTGGFGGHRRGGAPAGAKRGTPPAGAKFSARGRRGGKAGTPPGGGAGFGARSTALKACGVSFGSGPRAAGPTAG